MKATDVFELLRLGATAITKAIDLIEAVHNLWKKHQEVKNPTPPSDESTAALTTEE